MNTTQCMRFHGFALLASIGPLSFSSSSFAQAQFALEECALTMTPHQAERAQELQRLGSYTLPNPPEAPLRVGLTFHMVRRSDGTGGIPQSQLDQAVADANAHFAPEIQFCQPAPSVYIDDDFWYQWQSGATIDGLRSLNPVPGTINIYTAPSLGGICGISSFTFSPVQGIALQYICTAPANNHKTVSHEIGHYLDLFHTHESSFGRECTSGSNCATAGDFVCDTPADPNLLGLVDPQCQYTNPAGRLPCPGDPPYNPPTQNLMSYTPWACANHFTPQQHTRALATLVNLRTELDLTACGSSCYADCDQSTGGGVLDVFDFLCFQNSFVNADPYACDCDTTTGNGVCDIFDFLCFQDAFVAGCP